MKMLKRMTVLFMVVVMFIGIELLPVKIVHADTVKMNEQLSVIDQDAVPPLAPGDKVTLNAKKKVAEVTVSDENIVTTRIKGKKVIINAVSEGSVTVTAYNKKGKVIKSWYIWVTEWAR